MGFGIVQPARINQQFRVVNAYMLDYKQSFILRCPSNSQSPALFKGYLVGGIGIDHHRPIRLSRWFSSSWVLWPSWRSWTRTKAQKFSDLKWGLGTWNGVEKGLLLYSLATWRWREFTNLSLTNLWVFKNHVQLGQKTSGFCHAFQGVWKLWAISAGLAWTPWIKLGEAKPDRLRHHHQGWKGCHRATVDRARCCERSESALHSISGFEPLAFD